MAIPIPESLKYDTNGLIPVVVQDFASGDVLMVAFANAEAGRLPGETPRRGQIRRLAGEARDTPAVIGEKREAGFEFVVRVDAVGQPAGLPGRRRRPRFWGGGGNVFPMFTAAH